MNRSGGWTLVPQAHPDLVVTVPDQRGTLYPVTRLVCLVNPQSRMGYVLYRFVERRFQFTTTTLN